MRHGTQQSIGSLPEEQQDAAMGAAEGATERFPSVNLSTGERLHIFEVAPGTWEVWLNCEDADFTGICVAVAKTRQDAVTHAVAVFEAAVEELQKPPVRESAQVCGCDPGENHLCERHSGEAVRS
jgi:hypothetical protein